MPYHCTSCDLSFETETRPPRCPSCMRLSTVNEASPTRPLNRRAISRRLVLTLLFAVLSGAAGYVAFTLLNSPYTPLAPPSEALDDEALPPEEAAALLALRRRSGANAVAQHKLGDRSGADAARTLSHLVQGRFGAGSLRIIKTPEHLRRPPLELPLLTDGNISDIFEDGREAHLYPDELTLILWAIAKEAGLTAQIIWINPDEADLDTWPATALRVRTRQGWLAIDPFTGSLRSADQRPGGGPKQTLAALALLQAREALSHHQLGRAEAALQRAQLLVPDLWLVDALSALIAIERNDTERAKSLAKALSERSDHPFSWFVEAQAESLTPEGMDTAELIRRYQSITEAFPFEARLCVILGDLLRDAQRFEESWDAYEIALTRRAHVAGAHTGLALLYALVDPPRARQHLRDELEHNTDHAEAFLALAFMHALEGAESDAERVASRGRRLSFDPERYDASLSTLLIRARTHLATEEQEQPQ